MVVRPGVDYSHNGVKSDVFDIIPFATTPKSSTDIDILSFFTFNQTRVTPPPASTRTVPELESND